MTPSELKQLRGRLDFTQPELAEAIGVHPMTVSKWERGAQSIPEPVAKLIQRMVVERRPTKRKR